MARPKKDNRDLNRVQMDMPKTSYERLKRLQETTEAASYVEVMKNALRLYEALIEEHQQGNKFLIDREGNTAPYPIFSA